MTTFPLKKNVLLQYGGFQDGGHVLDGLKHKTLTHYLLVDLNIPFPETSSSACTGNQANTKFVTGNHHPYLEVGTHFIWLHFASHVTHSQNQHRQQGCQSWCWFIIDDGDAEDRRSDISVFNRGEAPFSKFVTKRSTHHVQTMQEGVPMLSGRGAFVS